MEIYLLPQVCFCFFIYVAKGLDSNKYSMTYVRQSQRSILCWPTSDIPWFKVLLLGSLKW